MVESEFFATNRSNWDERAGIHLRDATGAYRLDALRGGDNSLHSIEDAELGPVAGKRLVHLQCHFGRDSLALARRGAHVTGIDFSPEAIRAARRLAGELAIAATFVEGNVYEARNLIEGQFDIAFVTWGALPWLPDLKDWARVVSSLLGKEGYLYLAESHPSLNMLDEKDPHLRPAYDFRTPVAKPILSHDEATYTGDPTPLVHRQNYNWIHPLSDVIMAVMEAGLKLVFLHEHEEIPWPFAPFFVPIPGSNGMYGLPPGRPRLPLSFSLKAIKG